MGGNCRGTSKFCGPKLWQQTTAEAGDDAEDKSGDAAEAEIYRETEKRETGRESTFTTNG